MKNILLTSVTSWALLSSASLGIAAETTNQTAFQKDRKAILAMAGKFKVTFNFHETYTIKSDYKLKEKRYQESAYETVKVVEDDGKRIVLQHILQVDDGIEIMTVKHWGQVWTYQDCEILEYQNGTNWTKHTLPDDDVKGTWSQYVTQTDDSPRYESDGRWDHTNGLSIWKSGLTARPLPRREYSKRKDYDVLQGYNQHAITAKGWVHEQSNYKQVKRDGKQEHYLCQERGFNTYKRVSDHDFSPADSYWAKNAPFWKKIRGYWKQQIASNKTINYTRKIQGVSLGKATRKLMPEEDNAAAITTDTIDKALSPYLQAPAAKKPTT